LIYLALYAAITTVIPGDVSREAPSQSGTPFQAIVFNDIAKYHLYISKL
jgi:hypothetical protein